MSVLHMFLKRLKCSPPPLNPRILCALERSPVTGCVYNTIVTIDSEKREIEGYMNYVYVQYFYGSDIANGVLDVFICQQSENSCIKH